jgi:RHS repeat-associated protein
MNPPIFPQITMHSFMQRIRCLSRYVMMCIGCGLISIGLAAEDLGESDLASPYGKGRVSLLNMPRDQVPGDADLRALGQLGGPLSPLRSRIRDRRTKVAQEERAVETDKEGPSQQGGRNKREEHKYKYTPSDIKGLRGKRPHKSRELEDNTAFGAAMDKWNRHEYKEAVRLFREHKEKNPDSPWVGESALHLGCEAQFTGRWDEARNHFESILKIAEPGEDIWQKAKLRLSVLDLEQGMVAESQEGFAELLRTETDWGRATYAQNWIRQLGLMKGHLANVRTCGNESLAYILELRGQTEASGKLKARPAHGDYGYTLAELRDAAESVGLYPSAVEAETDHPETLPVPWIAHYTDKHYVVVTERDAATAGLRIFDPRLGSVTTLTLEQFASQWSGLALLLDGQTSPTARPASAEALARMGGCCGLPKPEGDTGSGCDCGESCACESCGGGLPGGGANGGEGGGPDGDAGAGQGSGGGSDGGGGCGTPSGWGGDFGGYLGLGTTGRSFSGMMGMPQWTVNPVNMNMLVKDTPLWYRPPYGMPIRITLTYNSLDALNELRPFGPKWTFNHASYLIEAPGGDVTVFTSSGRRDVYKSAGSGYSSPVKHGGFELVKTGAYTFTLQFPNGIKYYYAPVSGSTMTSSLLAAMEDQHGNTISYSYDTSGKLLAIIDPQNKQTTFEYNTENLVSKITDPFGRFCTFTYDSEGRLVGQTDMGGQSYGYEYATATATHGGVYLYNNIFITAINRPDGTVRFHTEPSDGIQNGSNAYPEPNAPMWDNYRITVTDPSGNKQEFYYNGYSRYGWHRDRVQYPLGVRSDNPYDPVNGPKTRFDFEYTSNSANAVISRITWTDGRYVENGDFTSSVQPQWTRDSQGNYHYYTYNGNGKVLTHRLPRGREIGYEYSGAGGSCCGDDIAAIKDRPDSSSAWQTLAQFEYNAQRQRIRTVNAAGQETQTDYDAQGRVTQIQQFATGTTQPSFTLTYSYNTDGWLESISRNGQLVRSFIYDNIGRVTTVTTAEGVSVSYSYDTMNRITAVTHADGTTENIAYGINGIASIINRQGKATHYSYDTNGRLASVKNPLGQNVWFTYDAEARLTGLQDAVGNPTHWEYNNVGRLVRKTYADGLGYTLSYNGDTRVTKTNARGQQLATYLDAHGNVTSVTATGEPTASYTYDYRDRLVTMSNEAGTTHFYYETAPSGRLVQVDGPWNNDTIDYTYDTLGRFASRSINGVPLSVTYDTQGRVSGETTPLGDFAYTYAGPVSGRVTQMSYPNGITLDIGYKTAQEELRLASLHYKNAADATISRFAYTYQAGGGGISSWEQQQDTNSKLWTLSYDKLDQLTDLVETNPGTDSITKRESWRYDAAGNRRLAQVDDSPVQSMHNALNQLLGMSGGETIIVKGQTDEPATVTVQGKRARLGDDNRFEAEIPVTTGANTLTIQATDASGNTRTSNYSATVSDVPERTFTYDADGNMLQEKLGGTVIKEYTWDVRNRLKSIAIDSNAYTFIYDAAGRRVKERINGSDNRTWLWTDGYQPDEERNTTGDTATRRYFGAGMQTVDGNQVQNYFYTRDHLGSIRSLVENTGTVQAYYDYDAWGNRSITRLTGNIDADFTFTGHLWHSPSQLGLTLFRGYDSQLGRWLNRDPIEELSGLNILQYVYNSPVNWIDPIGLTAAAAAVVILPEAGAGAGMSTLGPAAIWATAVLAWTPAGQEWIMENISTPFADWLYPDIEYPPFDLPTKCDAEHTKNARPSTKDKHQKGQRTKERPHWDKKRKHPDWESVPKRNR